MNSKELIKKSIMVVIALFSFLTLCFSLVSVRLFGASAAANGFDYLKLGQLDGFIPVLVGLLCYVHLLFGIAMIAVCASSFFDLSAMPFAKYIPQRKYLVLAALGSAALYLVEGIALIIHGKSQLSISYGTAAFWPLIITVILVGALWAVEQYLPETYDFASSGEGNSNEAPKATAPKTKQAISESERVELLTKYNDLLEKGIITQEEYDAKKKELLGL